MRSLLFAGCVFLVGMLLLVIMVITHADLDEGRRDE